MFHADKEVIKEQRNKAIGKIVGQCPKAKNEKFFVDLFRST